MALVVGCLTAVSMDACHRNGKAHARISAHSADSQLLSSDYPLTRRDWQRDQEEAIRREYGKIATGSAP